MSQINPFSRLNKKKVEPKQPTYESTDLAAALGYPTIAVQLSRTNTAPEKAETQENRERRFKLRKALHDFKE